MGVTAAMAMHAPGWRALPDALSLDGKGGPSPETLGFTGRRGVGTQFEMAGKVHSVGSLWSSASSLPLFVFLKFL